MDEPKNPLNPTDPTNPQTPSLGDTPTSDQPPKPVDTPIPPPPVEPVTPIPPPGPVEETPPASEPTAETPEPPPPAGGPFITPPKAGGNRAKIIATIVGLVLLLVSIPVAVTLIGQQQEIREKAREVVECLDDNGCPPGERCREGICVKAPTPTPTPAFCEKDCVSPQSECVAGTQVGGVSHGDCGAGEYCCQKKTTTPGCRPPFSQCETQNCCRTDSTEYECRQGLCQPKPTPKPLPPPGAGDCKPTVRFDGSPVCSERTLVSGQMTITVPAGCPAKTFNWKETVATCEGSNFAGCTNVTECGRTPTANSVKIDGGTSRTFDLRCNVPACGACQVDFSSFDFDAGRPSFGVKGYQSCGPPPPPPPPGEAAQCKNIKLYVADDTWTPITDTSTIKAGDKVRVAVKGNPLQKVDKARFRLNAGSWQQSTQKNPSDEFWFEFTIPNVTDITFEGMVHDKDKDQWF